jgi:hypothetical protein
MLRRRLPEQRARQAASSPTTNITATPARPDDPAAVQHGRAEQLLENRAHVLAAAYAATPERFISRPPVAPALPAAAWINKPDRQ